MASITKERYFNEYAIDREKARKRALVNTENGVTTAMTEMLGEAIIKKYKIWNAIFPNYQSVRKATSKKNQKEGTDFFLTTEEDTVLSIDIKVCCGPSFNLDMNYCYRQPEMFRELTVDDAYIKKQAPIELKQNGIRTFTSRKKTDYILFIFADDFGVSYHIMSYDEVLEKVDASIDKYEDVKDEKGFDKKVFNKNRGVFKHYTSNNGTGEYITVPVTATKCTS